ncbi:MAG: hypothetical protein V4570_01445 [Pseudomonadota bacterium]
MILKNDGDVIRGLGFVVLYAAYLEKQVDDLLLMLQAVELFPENEQRWATSKKIKKAKRLVAKLVFEYRDTTINDLDALNQLFDWRNEIIHGRIYVDFDSQDVLNSGRPKVLNRIIKSTELYDLAANLLDARSAIRRPMIFQIPKAIELMQSTKSIHLAERTK